MGLTTGAQARSTAAVCTPDGVCTKPASGSNARIASTPNAYLSMLQTAGSLPKSEDILKKLTSFGPKQVRSYPAL